jgi:hypothetical protein
MRFAPYHGSMKLVETDRLPATPPAPRSDGADRPSRPEFFRLPKSGVDPYFGLGRSYYYEGEKRGYWRLVRLRERGKLRGITLVPFDVVSSFVRSQAGGKQR